MDTQGKCSGVLVLAVQQFTAQGKKRSFSNQDPCTEHVSTMYVGEWRRSTPAKLRITGWRRSVSDQHQVVVMCTPMEYRRKRYEGMLVTVFPVRLCSLGPSVLVEISDARIM